MSEEAEVYRHPVEIAEAAVREDPWALEPGPPPVRPRWWHPMDGLKVMYWVFWRPDRLWWWVSDEARAEGEVVGWRRRAVVAGRLTLRGLIPVAAWALLIGILVQVLDIALSGASGGDVINAFPQIAVTTAAGVYLGLALGVTMGAFGGATLRLTDGEEDGVAVGMAMAVAFGSSIWLHNRVISATTLGLVMGVVTLVQLGVTVVPVLGIVAGIAAVIAARMNGGIAAGMTPGMAAGAAYMAVATGLLASLAEQALGAVSSDTLRQRRIFHPLAAFPHLTARRLLRKDFQESGPLQAARWWLRNPYRRVQVQRVITAMVERAEQPAKQLLAWIETGTSRSRLRLGPFSTLAPGGSLLIEALLLCAAGEVVVYDIDINGSTDPRLPPGESLAARITAPFARKPPPTLADFARGLRFLLHGVSLFDPPDRPDQTRGPRLLALLQGAAGLPDGAGLAQAYTALYRAGTLDDPNALADLPYRGPFVTAELPDLPAGHALRDAVSTLWTVASEVAAIRLVTGEVERAEALAAVQRRLVALSTARPVDLLPHDRALLNEVARRWLNLLVARGDRLARVTPPTPARSHYIAGPHVPPERLVGRDGLLATIDHTWSAPPGVGWRPLVLYGHRRMGKTSLLHALVPRFRDRAVVVVVSAQGLSWSAGRPAVCAGLALRLRGAARREGVELAESAPTDIHGWEEFVALIERVHEASGRRVVLAIDELEALRADPQLLDQLRALYTEAWWFTPVLAGLHDLTDPFLGATAAFAQLVADARQVPVGLLDPAVARALLLRPAPDADLVFEEDAVARILSEAAGQPYLLQHLGDLVVRTVNERLARGDTARVATGEDVARVLGDPLFDDARAYFVGVWDQANERPGADRVLRALARAEPVTRPTLSVGLPDAEALFTHLVNVRVLKESPAGLRFEVPAVRRWVRARQMGV